MIESSFETLISQPQKNCAALQAKQMKKNKSAKANGPKLKTQASNDVLENTQKKPNKKRKINKLAVASLVALLGLYVFTLIDAAKRPGKGGPSYDDLDNPLMPLAFCDFDDMLFHHIDDIL